MSARWTGAARAVRRIGESREARRGSHCAPRIIAWCLALSGLLASAGVRADPPRHRVVLDPGHGGQNMGAVGPYGVYEKYVTLAIALRLGRLLEAEPDVAVFYTRRDDVYVGLAQRAEIANAVQADLFVSIHCNADPQGRARGFETYYVGPSGRDARADEVARRENETPAAALQDPVLQGILSDLERNGALAESAAVAARIQQALARAFPGAPSRDVRQAAFTVLERARVPAVVVEVGFITHPEEGLDLLLATYQDRIAQALRDAILAQLRSGLSGSLRSPADARQ